MLALNMRLKLPGAHK